MSAILIAAYDMGGSTGWTVLVVLGVVPALTALGCLGVVLTTPRNRGPRRVSR